MKVYLDIIKLVWPLALGMANNALMQFIDRAFLARESMESLEAVLPASMLSFILLGFFQAVVAYSGTFVATYHGAGNLRLRTSAYRAGTVLAALFGALVLLFIPVGGIIFEAVSDGASLIAREKSYFSISTAAGIFLFGQMATQAYLTGCGRTKEVFLVSLVGNLVNIALDPIFIFGWLGIPALGIAGAATATATALCLQWIILAVIVERDIRIVRKSGETSHSVSCGEFIRLVWRIIRFGVPSGAYSTLNLVSFTAFVFFAGRVGHLEAAVSNACFTINYLLFAPIEGFSLGAATLVSQAKGAGDLDAARRAGWYSAIIATVFTTALLALTLLFYRPILELFAPSDPQAATEFISLGFILLLLMAAWQIFEVFDTVISGALKGAGDTSFVMWWMLVGAFAVWMPILTAVSLWHNTMPALWSTLVLEVAVLCAGTIFRWKRGKWQRIKLT